MATLLARDLFFKDWARDQFTGLSVFSAGGAHGGKPRCVISVKPSSRASLAGLGADLDRAESAARVQSLGYDDRKLDRETGARKEPRYEDCDNADPWYDGRGHGYTIVDSPESGTMLSADEIEAIVQRFGQALPDAPPP